jgi:hypothetical protein
LPGLCPYRSTGWVPVGDIPPEDPCAGEQLVVIIDQLRNSPAEDNAVTIQLRKFDGKVISQTIELTRLFDLIRERVDEHRNLRGEEEQDDEEE